MNCWREKTVKSVLRILQNWVNSKQSKNWIEFCYTYDLKSRTWPNHSVADSSFLFFFLPENMFMLILTKKLYNPFCWFFSPLFSATVQSKFVLNLQIPIFHYEIWPKIFGSRVWAVLGLSASSLAILFARHGLLRLGFDVMCFSTGSLAALFRFLLWHCTFFGKSFISQPVGSMSGGQYDVEIHTQ